MNPPCQISKQNFKPDQYKSILHLIYDRSKNRIRDSGEVFTYEKYVNQMLDMLDKSVWTDINIFFYEPICGLIRLILK